jgi:hypothetical protein
LTEQGKPRDLDTGRNDQANTVSVSQEATTRSAASLSTSDSIRIKEQVPSSE